MYNYYILLWVCSCGWMCVYVCSCICIRICVFKCL